MSQQVADAMRTVAVKLQRLIDAGERSRMIGSDDLIEAMLAVADELDPARAVPRACACEVCGQRDPDKLIWIDDATVRCECGWEFSPRAQLAN